jgi:hypothetical protein
MRFDRFMKAADERNAAIVMQVSWANGLDIIRDLSRDGVPLRVVKHPGDDICQRGRGGVPRPP